MSMSNDSDSDQLDFSLDTLFPEPSRPPSPEPTLSVYTRDHRHSQQHGNRDDFWTEIEIGLVGTHSLWGHYLWNAARALASYLDKHPQLYRNRSVLELGAGGGLPGIVAAKNGAYRVVLTDYPDSDLIKNLEQNVVKNISPSLRDRISVWGYLWGRPVEHLLEPLFRSPNAASGFDLIVMSDLIFNHSQHDELLTTCELALSQETQSRAAEPFASSSSPSLMSEQLSTQTEVHKEYPSLLVFYTHHRPHLAHRDLEFFTKASKRGWICEEILTQKFPPMFPDDPGEEEVRSTVHGWRLWQTW